MRKLLTAIAISLAFAQAADAQHWYYRYLGPLLPIPQTNPTQPSGWACTYGQNYNGATLELCQQNLVTEANNNCFPNVTQIGGINTSFPYRTVPAWVYNAEAGNYQLTDDLDGWPPSGSCSGPFPTDQQIVSTTTPSLSNLSCPSGSVSTGQATCGCSSSSIWEVMEQGCYGSNVEVNGPTFTVGVKCGGTVGDIFFADDTVSWVAPQGYSNTKVAIVGPAPGTASGIYAFDTAPNGAISFIYNMFGDLVVPWFFSQPWGGFDTPGCMNGYCVINHPVRSTTSNFSIYYATYYRLVVVGKMYCATGSTENYFAVRVTAY